MITMLSSIFKPNLPRHPVTISASLDFNTPKGIFRSSEGNVYLICDDPDWRFAVVLRHKNLPNYSYFKLGEHPVEHGIAEGIGEILLIDAEINNSTFDRRGTLRVTANSVEMFLRDASGWEEWILVDYGRCNYQLGDFKTWKLASAAGHILFEGNNFDDDLDDDDEDDEDDE